MLLLDGTAEPYPPATGGSRGMTRERTGPGPHRTGPARSGGAVQLLDDLVAAPPLVVAPLPLLHLPVAEPAPLGLRLVSRDALGLRVDDHQVLRVVHQLEREVRLVAGSTLLQLRQLAGAPRGLQCVVTTAHHCSFCASGLVGAPLPTACTTSATRAGGRDERPRFGPNVPISTPAAAIRSARPAGARVRPRPFSGQKPSHGQEHGPRTVGGAGDGRMG